MQLSIEQKLPSLLPRWANVSGNCLRLVMEGSYEESEPFTEFEDSIVSCSFPTPDLGWVATTLIQRDGTLCNFSVNAAIALSTLVGDLLAIARPNRRLTTAAALVRPHSKNIPKAEVSTVVSIVRGVYWVGGGSQKGEPHVVHLVESQDALQKLPSELYPLFMNHTFVWIEHHEPNDDSTLQSYTIVHSKTWHRGICRFVQSSGTGAVAVSAFLFQRLLSTKIQIHYPGGYYKTTCSWIGNTVMVKCRICTPVQFNHSTAKIIQKYSSMSRDYSFPNRELCKQCQKEKQQCDDCRQKEWKTWIEFFETPETSTESPETVKEPGVCSVLIPTPQRTSSLPQRTPSPLLPPPPPQSQPPESQSPSDTIDTIPSPPPTP